MLRGNCGDAAGAELGSSFAERITVNTGTVPVLPAPGRCQRPGGGLIEVEAMAANGTASEHATGPEPVAWPAWPRLMCAKTAAAYVDEKSVEAFRRGIPKLYPKPLKISGKGERWLKEALDEAIDRLTGKARVTNIVDLL